MARNKVKIMLPSEYKHPFDCPVVSMKASFTTKGLPEDCNVPAFEFQLSTVKLDLSNKNAAGKSATEADKFLRERYNISLQGLIDKGLSQIGYSIDDKVIAILYDEIEDAFVAEDIPPVVSDRHLLAQAAADEWKWTPATGKAKTTKVETMVKSLVAKGFLPESAIAEITTDADLQSAIASATAVE